SRITWATFAESQRGEADPEHFELGGLSVFYTTVHISDEQRPFPYAVAAAVPPNQEAYTICVSDDVPESLRGLWAWHELHDFSEVGHDHPKRCVSSEIVVAAEMDPESDEYQEYIKYRIHFYMHLEKFMAEDIAAKGEVSEYDPYDVEGCQKAIQFLRGLRIKNQEQCLIATHFRSSD
ncbi:MAG TPA: hypothetical protein PKV52_04390, partial [Candidatus Saccharibacteria bacterium]|nr:hypothetical protein [Candidatus Saccharibacteria bacterium]